MLISIAHRLSQSARWRHALFALAALCAILLIGYHFGTFDQTIHLPFLKKYADPALYSANEEFFSLRFQHYSYFWFLFLPFYQWGVLEPVLFVVHYLATYLTFWAVWVLADTLFHDPLAGLLAVAAFIVPHVGFSGFPIFEFSLLNRTVVLPFLLIAVNLFLQRRHVGALALIGVTYNFHVLSSTFVLGLFLFAGLFEYRRIGARTAVASLLTFGLCASPLLAWRALSPPVNFAPQPDWFWNVSQGMFLHLFYFVAPYPHILFITLSGLSGLALFLIALRQCLSEHDRVVGLFVAAAMLILLIQGIATYTWPITILAQSQVMRVGLLALIFNYLYFAGYLAARYRSGALRGADFGWQAIAFITGIFPIIPLAIWLIQRRIHSARWRQTAAGLTVAGTFAGGLVVAQVYQLWLPGIYVYARPTAWHRAQLWARDNTPPDAVFITPLDKWWLYDADWRVFSERAQVVSFADMLEVAIVPDYLATWEQRFDAFAPGARAQFRGNVYENRLLTAAAYESLSDDDLLRLARAYDADYVVVEKPDLRPWPVAYENEQFVIYLVGQ
jgi:hypothetical protein